MPQFLIVSIVASVVLTVLLNVALRAFPRSAERLDERVTRLTERPSSPAHDETGRVRVVFPWKAMLIGSLVLTVVLNLLLMLR